MFAKLRLLTLQELGCGQRVKLWHMGTNWGQRVSDPLRGDVRGPLWRGGGGVSLCWVSEPTDLQEPTQEGMSFGQKWVEGCTPDIPNGRYLRFTATWLACDGHWARW